MAMCDFFELMIALRFAELHDVAAELTPSHASLRSLAATHPDEWTEQLAQVANLWEFGARLPAEFARLIHGEQ
jgi:hypothetical protein